MISKLASPSVCVIDDEEIDYRPILNALNELFVSAVHIVGTVPSLPPTPFNGLRLVFLDLHLSNTVGKNAASYTANVFQKVVSVRTAPVVVIIWSKYASDKIIDSGLPPEDQETEAELFKRTLLEDQPLYNGRLIFLEMAKPKTDRPPDWTNVLREEIKTALQDQSAIDLIWAWENLVREGCLLVTDELTSVAQGAVVGTDKELKDGLKATLQQLAKAQGEGDLSSANASNHLLTALGQILADQLENPSGLAGIIAHGAWLIHDPGKAERKFVSQMNALLMTSALISGSGPFSPGTVFRILNPDSFNAVFGKPYDTLVQALCPHKVTSQKFASWRDAAVPVLIELTPVCDVAQKYRVSSLLIAGLLVPFTDSDQPKSGDAFGSLPVFKLRWPTESFGEQDVRLLYCHRFRVTLPADNVPDWIEPWFRLRDMPTTAIRNSSAAHASRIGYVSMH